MAHWSLSGSTQLGRDTRARATFPRVHRSAMITSSLTTPPPTPDSKERGGSKQPERSVSAAVQYGHGYLQQGIEYRDRRSFRGVCSSRIRRILGHRRLYLLYLSLTPCCHRRATQKRSPRSLDRDFRTEGRLQVSAPATWSFGLAP